MRKASYSDEDIILAVKNSKSYAGVLRELGIKQAGGSQTHIKRRIDRIGISTKHFTGERWNKGLQLQCLRKTSEQILILYPDGNNRIGAYYLRRALLDIGFEEHCEQCGITDTYNGKPIRLHIDHKDGNSLDCRPHNLRFLCPNCHSQTSTFGNKRR